MPTTPTDFTTEGSTLYMALELSSAEWLLTFATGPAQARRQIRIRAGDRGRLLVEVGRAKAKLHLSADAPVVSCYEAGRDGFWIHRFLIGVGIANIVVDPASIEVNRRFRRAKTDPLDGAGLVRQLARWQSGERDVWKVVTVPDAAAEDERQPVRERLELVEERTRLINRMRGLLAGVGTVLPVAIGSDLAVDALRQWDGQPLPVHLRARLERDRVRLQVLESQIAELEQAQRRAFRDDATSGVEAARRLLSLKGIGPTTSWLLVREVFGWRRNLTVKQVGALAGLCPTPYSSGESDREQGISKAGNRRVRWAMVELAWGWLNYQPASELSRWYQAKYGGSSGRHRKVGIVALARKLLAALLRVATAGVMPAGATVGDWRAKLNGRSAAAA